MRIVGKYSFNRGEEEVTTRFPKPLKEIEDAIVSINAEEHRTKESKEKTMKGKMLFNPTSLNKAFKKILKPLGWESPRVHCDYPTEYFIEGYRGKTTGRRHAYREMDFVKDKLGVEIQLGKYSFMVYNVCAKMTIFHKLGIIDYGIEIVPVKEFAAEMSTGVSYFEQFVWDLEHRGVSDIDIPVFILGITSVDDPSQGAKGMK